MLRRPISTELASRIYQGLNATPIIWWLAMIFLPKWRGTHLLTSNPALFTAFGAFYTAFLAKTVAEVGAPDFGSFEKGPRRIFASNSGVLAGWAHYLAFDLFVGVWIYRTGLVEGRSTRLPLFLTFLAGPLGLLWFIAQRGVHAFPPFPFDSADHNELVD